MNYLIVFSFSLPDQASYSHQPACGDNPRNFVFHDRQEYRDALMTKFFTRSEYDVTPSPEARRSGLVSLFDICADKFAKLYQLRS